jgi:hypothetical protein
MAVARPFGARSIVRHVAWRDSFGKRRGALASKTSHASRTIGARHRVWYAGGRSPQSAEPRQRPVLGEHGRNRPITVLPPASPADNRCQAPCGSGTHERRPEPTTVVVERHRAARESGA